MQMVHEMCKILHAAAQMLQFDSVSLVEGSLPMAISDVNEMEVKVVVSLT